MRDLLKIKPGQTTFDLRRLMRPIVVIPEAMPVPKALHLMQQRHVQMVLVQMSTVVLQADYDGGPRRGNRR